MCSSLDRSGLSAVHGVRALAKSSSEGEKNSCETQRQSVVATLLALLPRELSARRFRPAGVAFAEFLYEFGLRLGEVVQPVRSASTS